MKTFAQSIVRTWRAVRDATIRALATPYEVTPAHRELWKLSRRP